MSDLVAPFTALTVLAGLYYRYKNDAIGCPVRVDPRIPRISYHLPLIGSLRVLAYGDIEDMLTILQSEFEANPETDKLVMSMPTPAQPPYLVSINPKDVEHVLINNFEAYEKGDDFKYKTKDLFGHGIFASDGAEWVFQRKVAAKVFTTKSFKSYFETVFLQNTPLLLDRLGKAAQSQGTANGLPSLPQKDNEFVDMHDLFHRFFIDSFGKIAFGADLEALTGKDIPFTAAFDRSQSVLMNRFLDPFYLITERFMPQIRKDFKTVREFGQQVVNDRRDGKIKGADGDLISLFFKYKDDEDRSLTDDQMIDQVVNFLIAGRDTTAQALSWTLYCLSQNPRCVEIMLEEINRITDDNLVPTYEQVKEMKYTKAVFNETLRLYPSVAKDAKVAVKDDVLPDGTQVAKGTIFVYFAYGMGRSERIWEDPLAFKPERWLTGKNYSPVEYPAFNAGPRICLGKSLAELQGVLVLASITKHFEFEIARPEEVLPKSSLTLPMLNGLKCRVKRR